MEIKVNDYIRTKNGKIGKVIDISNITGQLRKKYLIKWNISKAYYITNITIIKNGKNIIDLIEIGDFVNGCKVLDIMEDMKSGEIHLEMTSNYTNLELGDCTIYDKDIKTILTHEQFEQNCYRLEEK